MSHALFVLVSRLKGGRRAEEAEICFSAFAQKLNEGVIKYWEGECSMSSGGDRILTSAALASHGASVLQVRSSIY